MVDVIRMKLVVSDDRLVHYGRSGQDLWTPKTSTLQLVMLN